MTSIATSVNHLLATHYSQVQRPAAPANNTNANTNSFSRELFGDLKPGTNVSTRTDYVVGNNGKLQRAGTQINIGELADSQQQVLPYAYHQGRSQNFTDLTKPKAQLSPTDEARVFDADTLQGEGGSQGPLRYFDSQGAEDENGEAVEVEILAPEASTNESQPLRAKQQANVSNLYARNNDIVYTAEPMLAFAA